MGVRAGDLQRLLDRLHGSTAGCDQRSQQHHFGHTLVAELLGNIISFDVITLNLCVQRGGRPLTR